MKNVVLATLLLFSLQACSQPTGTDNKESDMTIPTDLKVDTATFGAGCFWCVEAVFQELKGVLKVESGYSGGFVDNPTYKQICYENTGHAEVTRIVFDPEDISYSELLEVFWSTHDPTTLNRQGNDSGTQYRSVIYYHNEKQKEEAELSLKNVGQPLWEDKIVTEISALINYFPAEDYHQNYYSLNPNQGYCRVIINPKVIKFRQKFADKLKSNE